LTLSEDCKSFAVNKIGSWQVVRYHHGPPMNIFLNCKNSKMQGDVGLGAAIAHFTKIGTVSVPLTDSQDYDLIVDINGSLKKVQVKTSNQKIRRCFKITLCTKGGNKSRNTIKKFCSKSVDLLFCLTADDTSYLIHSEEVTSTVALTLFEKYDKFKISKGENPAG